MMNKKFFGKFDENDVFVYNIKSDNIEAEVLNMGAVLHSLKVRGKGGEFVDVIGGYNTIDGYINGIYKHGAIIGRCANRISKGRLNIDGKHYQLSINCHGNHLHGGFVGYHRKMWSVENCTDDTITLKIIDPDGTEGYPGTVVAYVTYTVAEDSLYIDVEATTDKPTIINITNHSFFNLNGFDSSSIRNHYFKIYCENITLNDESDIPTGEIANISDTAYDFTVERKIPLPAKDIYDLNYYFNRKFMDIMATAYSPDTNIMLSLYSDMPSMQFYTVENSACYQLDKNGNRTEHNSWFCLEPQYAPDTPNHSNFMSNVVRPGEKYSHRIAYKFSNK